jgi:hypothetical protein
MPAPAGRTSYGDGSELGLSRQAAEREVLMHDWVMSARCPVCGAAATKVVAGGYFQCEAPVAAATGAPPSGAFGPTTVITSCGWRFLPTELTPEATSALESAAQREREARAAAERQQRAEQDAMALLPEVSRLFLQHGQRKPTRVVFTTTFAPPGMGPVRFTKDALRAEKTPAAGSFRSWVRGCPGSRGSLRWRSPA